MNPHPISGVSDPGLKSGSRSSPESTAERLKSEVRERGAEVTRRLRERAGRSAEDQKSRIAETTRDLGAAIRRAADELHERNEERTAEWAEAIAEQLEAGSDYLERHGINDIYRHVEDATRRRPGLLLGGLFVAGVAASRFVKASRERRAEDESHATNDEPMAPEQTAAYRVPPVTPTDTTQRRPL